MMNINQFDQLYRERITATGVTGSDVTMETERVAAKRIRVITHLSVENKTSAYSKCRLEIYNGAIDFNIDEAIFPSQNELLVHPKDILLGEGDRLRVKLAGTQTDDELELHAIGWEMPRE